MPHKENAVSIVTATLTASENESYLNKTNAFAGNNSEQRGKRQRRDARRQRGGGSDNAL